MALFTVAVRMINTHDYEIKLVNAVHYLEAFMLAACQYGEEDIVVEVSPFEPPSKSNEKAH